MFIEWFITNPRSCSIAFYTSIILIKTILSYFNHILLLHYH